VAASAGGPVLLCCSSQTFACGRYRLCWPIFHARTPPGHAVSSLKLWGFMLFHSFFRLFYWILFWGYPPFHVLKLVRLLCYSHSGFSFRFVLWNKKEKRKKEPKNLSVPTKKVKRFTAPWAVPLPLFRCQLSLTRAGFYPPRVVFCVDFLTGLFPLTWWIMNS
jgi:hypothetical protein